MMCCNGVCLNEKESKKNSKIYKKKILDFYDEKLAFNSIGDFIGGLENKSHCKIKNAKFEDFHSEGCFLDIYFLIATKRGLFSYSHDGITELIGDKGFYGVTYKEDRVYAFHQTGLHGRIISFQIDENKVINTKIIIYGLSKGVHQIDIIGDDLYVVNTYQNSILVFYKVKKISSIHWKKYDEIIYPNKKIKNGRKSINYSHFNSIYKFENITYLVAHNETRKTQQNSQIYCLNDRRDVVQKIDMHGSNCHNIFVNKEYEMYCKSLESRVTVNKKDIIKYENILTRGLSVSRKYIIIGGSDIEFDRFTRNHTNGHIFLYDQDVNLKQRITINNTQVQEIRQLKVKDFSLSNCRD